MLAKLFFLLIPIVSLLSCGGGEKSASNNSSLPTNAQPSEAAAALSAGLASEQLVTTWVQDTTTDHLTIYSSGTISSSLCGTQGSITGITPENACPEGADTCGTVNVSITKTNGTSGCVPPGNRICAYVTWFSLYLTFNCGGNSITYERL